MTEGGQLTQPEPDCLLAIEAFFQGYWAPVTFGKEAFRLTTDTAEAAGRIIVQLRQVHIAKGKQPPVFRYRLMSKDETTEVRRLIRKRGQSGKFGSDPRNRSIQSPGKGNERLVE